MANHDLLLLILLPIIGILPIVMLLILDILSVKKAIILYFDTEKTAKFVNTTIKDGLATIQNKQFYLDKVKPVMIRSGILIKPFKPLYVLKWNKAIPMEFSKNGLESTTSAENLKNLIENKTLTNLLTPKGEPATMIMFLVIGAVVGGLVGYTIGG